MKHKSPLLLADAAVNLFLGIVLLAYSAPVIKFFGLPETDLYFYPNILGAILFGIGIALIIAYRSKGAFAGLGLGGAISINMVGGIVLFFWLVSGELSIPLKGKIILWSLDILLVVISTVELAASLGKKKKKQEDV